MQADLHVTQWIGRTSLDSKEYDDDSECAERLIVILPAHSNMTPHLYDKQADSRAERISFISPPIPSRLIIPLLYLSSL